jgi:hypothetical protein
MPDDEAERSPGEAVNWKEAHRLDAVFPDNSSAVSLMVAKHPVQQRASFAAAYLRKGEAPIVLAEAEIERPRQRWELRASGLWADHICETPLEHWSYGLEAFALAIEEPGDLVDTGLGDRVPLGWELEFEHQYPAIWMGPDCYQQVGEAHGLILTKDGETEVAGVALRTHWWGEGGPVELHVGRGHRPVHSRALLPGMGETWSLEVGPNGMRIRSH